MKLSSARPSAGLVIGVAALVVALGGTGYAASKISGSQIKKHSVSGNRLKGNTLTGKQIKESTLGAVPKAKTAKNAGHASHAATAVSASSVNGNAVRHFSVTVATDDPSVDLPIPGGLLKLSCPGHDPTIGLAGTSATDNGTWAQIAENDGNIGSYVHTDSALTSADDDALAPVGGNIGGGVAVIASPDGGVTSITYSYSAQLGSTCGYAGTIVGDAT